MTFVSPRAHSDRIYGAVTYLELMRSLYVLLSSPHLSCRACIKSRMHKSQQPAPKLSTAVCFYRSISTNTMSDLLAMVPLEPNCPLQYPRGVLTSVLQRRRLETTELLEALEKLCKAIKLDFQLYDHLNASNYAAVVNNITVDYEPAEERDRLWIFATTLVIFLFLFDDHFDKPTCSPENASILSTEVKTILRAFRKHTFNGLQGELEDWPASVPLKEAYLWLLKEAEELREGAAEVLHYAFTVFVHGIEDELREWGPDAYDGDLSTWDLQRYDEVRKYTGGAPIALVPTIFIINKWTKKEHFVTCAWGPGG